MKILSTKVAKGKRRVVVELEVDEAVMAVREDAYYQLGGQVNDVVPGFVLGETRQVTWDHLQQKWSEA